jgi:TP901 family phage tail tape measure protein
MATIAELVVRVGADVGGLQRGLGTANNQINQFGSRAEAAIGRVKTQVADLTRQAALVGTGMSAAVTAPLVAVGKGALDLATGYQGAMNMVQAVTQATAAQMEGLDRTAIALGADMSLPATSAKDAALSMVELSKAGLSVQDTMDAAKGSLQLAAAGQLDNANAAAISAQALNAFGLAGKEATRVADMLAAGANVSAASVGDLAIGMQQGGFAFAAAKQPIDHMITALAALTNVGLTGSDAGTALKNAMIRLMSPTQEAAKLMNKLNLSVYDTAGNMLPFPQIIENVSRATAGMTQEQRNAALETIFLSDGMKAMIPLLALGKDGFVALEQQVQRHGAAADLAGAMTKGLGGAIEGLKSQVETFLLNEAKPFLDTLEGWVRKAADFIPKLSQMDPALKSLGLALIVAVAAAGPLLVIMAGLTSALGFILSPLGLVIAGVIALGTAFAANVGGIRDAVLPALIAVGHTLANVLTPALQGVVTFVREHGQALAIFFGTTLVIAFTAWAASATAAAIATVAAMAPVIVVLGVVAAAVAAFAFAWEGDWFGIREVTRAAITSMIQFLGILGIAFLELARFINRTINDVIILSLRAMGTAMAILGNQAGANMMFQMANGFASRKGLVDYQLLVMQRRLWLFAAEASKLGWLAGDGFTRNLAGALGAGAAAVAAGKAASLGPALAAAAGAISAGRTAAPQITLPAISGIAGAPPIIGSGGGGSAADGARNTKSAIEAAADMTKSIADAIKAGVEALQKLGSFRLPENFEAQVELFARAVDTVMMRLQAVALKYKAEGLALVGQYGDASGKLFSGLSAAFGLFADLHDAGNRILHGPAKLAELAVTLSEKVRIVMNELGSRIGGWDEFATTKMSRFADSSKSMVDMLSAALDFFVRAADSAAVVNGPVKLASVAVQIAEKVIIVMNELGSRIPLWDEFSTTKIARFAEASGKVMAGLTSGLEFFLKIAENDKLLSTPVKLAAAAVNIAEKVVVVMNELGSRIPLWDEFATTKIGQFAEASRKVTEALASALRFFDALAQIDVLPARGVLDAFFNKLDEWLELVEMRSTTWQKRASEATAKLSKWVGDTVGGLAGAFGPLSDLGSKLDALPSRGVLDFFFGKVDQFLDAFQEKAADFASKANETTAKISGYVGGTVGGIGNAIGVLGDLGGEIDALPSRGVIDTLFEALDGWLEDFNKKAGAWASRANKSTAELAGFIGQTLSGIGHALDPLTRLVDFKAPTEESIHAFFLALDEVLRVFALRSQEWKDRATPEVAALATNVGTVMEGINKALDPIIKMEAAQKITQEQVEGSFARIWDALHFFNVALMQSTEFEGDWGKRAVEFAKSIGEVFSSVKSAIDVLTSIGGDGAGGGKEGGTSIFAVFKEAFDKDNEKSLLSLWNKGFDDMFQKGLTWANKLRYEVFGPAFNIWNTLFINQTDQWATSWASAMNTMALAAEDFARRANAAFNSIPGYGSSGGGGGTPPPAPLPDPNKRHISPTGYNPNHMTASTTNGRGGDIYIGSLKVGEAPKSVHDWLVQVGQHRNIYDLGGD